MARHLLAGLLLCLITTFVQAQDKVSGDKATIHRDLVCGKGGDKDLKLDLVVPPGSGPFPLIIFIHGGGWRGGSYKDPFMQMAMMRYVKAGYAGACIGYRLTPTGARFPAQIEDCKCAVRWLRAHAGEYHLDPDRFGCIGASAGGHLSLLLGLTAKADGLEGTGDLKAEYAQASSAVQAVVNLFGPTDLMHGDWEKNVEPVVVDLLGGPVAEKKDLAKQASPLTYVREGSKLPPILTFHGTNDRTVPYIHATKLQQALDGVHASSKLVTMEGEGHGWFGPKLEPTLKQCDDFFAKHLRKK
jgi:acetyl esterase/lipase